MQIRYFPASLSKREQESLDAVLLAELEIQSWFAVVYSTLLSEEIIVVVQ